MNRKNNTLLAVLLTVLGMAALAAGLLWARCAPSAALPWVLVGLGCGAFGHGVGELANRRALANSPELCRCKESESTDERNIALTERAKARAYDAMVYLFGALMNVETAATLLLAAAYLVVVGCNVT